MAAGRGTVLAFSPRRGARTALVSVVGSNDIAFIVVVVRILEFLHLALGRGVAWFRGRVWHVCSPFAVEIVLQGGGLEAAVPPVPRLSRHIRTHRQLY
jgi:hypothetical protein